MKEINRTHWQKRRTWQQTNSKNHYWNRLHPLRGMLSPRGRGFRDFAKLYTWQLWWIPRSWWNRCKTLPWCDLHDRSGWSRFDGVFLSLWPLKPWQLTPGDVCQDVAYVKRMADVFILRTGQLVRSRNWTYLMPKSICHMPPAYRCQIAQYKARKYCRLLWAIDRNSS